ncbi:tRNA nucleotidyltransferase, partial [Candidatus Sulcia muelleri]|nr:tRNA nucleotidyltransferase [Candidatus Karelsulcia muelleri]
MNCIKAIDKKIFFIIRFYVNKMNKKSYVVGGYVRDFLIGKNVCKKVYIVTVGDCIKLAKKVCEKLDHKHKINIFK